MYDVKDIRDGLIERIAKAPAGGVFHSARTEPAMRNAFCLQVEENGQIYTVTITVGGALTSKS